MQLAATNMLSNFRVGNAERGHLTNLLFLLCGCLEYLVVGLDPYGGVAAFRKVSCVVLEGYFHALEKVVHLAGTDDELVAFLTNGEVVEPQMAFRDEYLRRVELRLGILADERDDYVGAASSHRLFLDPDGELLLEEV